MNLYSSLVVCLALFGAYGCSTTTENGRQENLLIGEFEITNAGGHWIGVPVSMGNLERLMLLDTGASISVFGSEFEGMLGRQRQKIVVRYGGEPTYLKGYQASGLRIGETVYNHKFRVAVMDYPDGHILSKNNLRGVLSGKFFSNRILCISYENKRVEVYSRAPSFVENMGPPIPFEWIDGHPLPHVRGYLPDGSEALFLIDTGAAVGLVLEQELFDAMVEIGELQNLKNKSKRSTQFINSSERIGELSQFRIGSMSQRNINTGDSISENIVGNKFLSRYFVVLDYIDNKLYLKPRSVWVKDVRIREDFSTNNRSIEIVIVRIDPEGKVLVFTKSTDGSRSNIDKESAYWSENAFSIESLHDKVGGSEVISVDTIRDSLGRETGRVTREFHYSFEVDGNVAM